MPGDSGLGAIRRAQPAAQRRHPPPTEKRGRMAMPENKEPIRTTAEDLATVTLPEPVVPGAMLPAQFGAKNYGSIADAADQGPAVAEDKGSILLQGWFYLGVAGLL